MQIHRGPELPIDDLNWMDVEEYLRSEERLMLGTGSKEQHGYLSLLTDVKIAVALAAVPQLLEFD